MSENSDKISEKNYYRELHAAARNYNTKLWTIPGLFILVAGFVLKGLEFDSIEVFATLENFILLVGGGIIIFMLLLQSYKDSFFQISIQKKINKLDEKIGESKSMPLYSATDVELAERILELKKDREADFKLSGLREFFVRRNVSHVFFGAVYLSLLGIAAGLLLIIFEVLR